ncbi:MAG: aminotransferase class I/II-fold pyridoxal phosphate-dependent enzyme, partial [Beijerinckiaceae bacterium]|nr:aminotransferase class I/II-fold pyridoxal phosphate-dependent enzyme [Beijerinckiaceae bacterium]
PALRALADGDPEAARHILYVSSLSKTVSPGARIGWLVLPPALLVPFKHMKATADIHSSLLSQAIMEAYLGLQRLPARVALARQTYRAKAGVLIRMLKQYAGPSFDFETPVGGMFIWSKLKVPGSSVEFARFALQHDVSVVPGEPFFSNDPETDRLRLSFTQGTHDEIERGARRLSAAIGAWTARN